MRTFKIAVLAALCAAIPTSAAIAADIEEEMDKWVIKPCMHFILASTVVQQGEIEAAYYDIDELLENVMEIPYTTVSKMRDRIRPVVQDVPWEARRDAYKHGLQSCTNGAKRGMDAID